jgi:hypothetical protein
MPSSGSNIVVREELAEPVRRVLRWLLALRDSSGALVCPDHGIEHTGKNAGAIVMACELARRAPGGEAGALRDAAVQLGRRLVARLEREGESTCFTFRPGRHDPYNCSNNVIDGGACSDALAELVQCFGAELSADDRAAFTRAAVLHAQTYLRYTVVDKGVPAQRAWAMTGLAQAFDLARHEVLELAVTEGARLLAEVQHADGSYPYHPLEWGAGHVGASDVSAYYQSRVTAFLAFALERAHLDPTDERWRGPIGRGLEFLLGLQGPDGIKAGLVEAKPWYWGAPYEVASHPFDVYALCAGWRLFGAPRFGAGALRAWHAWVRHLGPDGRPASHAPGPGHARSYQCPVFWAGHASWAARALADLEQLAGRADDAPGAGALELVVRHFPDASLTRLEDGRVAAWVRGTRPGFNVHHGSPHGAGLVRVVRQGAGAELLARGRRGGVREGEWSGRLGLPSLARGWRSGAPELRFAGWLARNAWRGKRRAEALLAVPRVVSRGVLAYGAARVGSAFELTPVTELLPDGVRLESRLARRDGTPVAASSLVRTFRVDGGGLVVEERCRSDGGARGLDYRVPPGATELERADGKLRYRLA